ncbi:MAG TPA: ThiF family adenylyltransferase [Fimbriimonadaceae bacterium]|nr:ThiF family adenylyltransferase [Fimbriimonadaceae bacterium]
MTTERTSRQSFLGDHSDDQFARVSVAVLGLGGGGSHIVQQLGHIGFSRIGICDPDVAEESNLNRLVGATEKDVEVGARKVDIASRMIKGLRGTAKVQVLFGRWEEHANTIADVDLIFGCLDGYAARRDLESFARRHLIPLIDIGMDVHRADGAAPQMSGQVIVSMPGGPCMWCLNYLNNVVLTREAEKYGAAGPRPQVVWPNGILASAAVGIAVDLLTGWTQQRPPIYLELDGNSLTLAPPARLALYDLQKPCRHFPADDVDHHGDPVFKVR